MSEQFFQGHAVSAGVAVGAVFAHLPVELTVPHRPPDSPSVEMARFYQAREQARGELEGLMAMVPDLKDIASQSHMQSLMVMLFDPLLEDAVERRISRGLIVEAAVKHGAGEIADMMFALGDARFASRTPDILELGERLLRILLGFPDTSLSAIRQPSVIVAYDLTPADTAIFDRRLVQGFCLLGGGRASHAAILAQMLDIPAVVNLGQAFVDSLGSGSVLAVDGFNGVVVIDPTEATLTHFQHQQQQHEVRNATFVSTRLLETRTRDGHRIAVQANIADLTSALNAVEAGAEGVGLLRTEFLYLNNVQPPTEDEQVGLYREIFAAVGDRPIVVRTLDVGASKAVSFIDFPQQKNPELGWRGIRVSLDLPDLFKTQLRALMRASVGKNVSIMYPMIESVTTMRRANRLFAEARAELESAQISYALGIPVGAMIETPAAAVCARLLSSECDFFSIGTNDLAQYALACDRTDQEVARYYEAFSPAVLWLIKHTIDAGHATGTQVSLCGELAGMPTAIPVLIGLGIDKLSMTSTAIPQAKYIVNHFTRAEMTEMAQQALMLPTAEDIHAYMADIFEAHHLD